MRILSPSRLKVHSLIKLSAFQIIVVLITASLLIIPGPFLGGSQNARDSSTYLGIAKYYDGRRCAVTATLDDIAPRGNGSVIQNPLSMLTQRGIYHTLSVITSPIGYNITDWRTIQYWSSQGYTEIASESRTHPHAPYIGIDPSTGFPRFSYAWQILGSRSDILGNLTLPAWWRSGNRQYVYAWIEPYGSTDSNVTQMLGLAHFIADRASISGMNGFIAWDSTNSIYHRIGYTHEMGNAPWGGTSSLSTLNYVFDKECSRGSIYHIAAHPYWVNWTRGGYADLHTKYISHRPDVWYVPLGLLYLYHWVHEHNITQVTGLNLGGQQTFTLGINATYHRDYGLTYPVTYIFHTPSNWGSVIAYYRYSSNKPWILLQSKGAGDFFNGVQALRYDSQRHRAFVSLSYSSDSDQIFIRLVAAVPWYTLVPNVLQIALMLLLPLVVGTIRLLRRSAVFKTP